MIKNSEWWNVLATVGMIVVLIWVIAAAPVAQLWSLLLVTAIGFILGLWFGEASDAPTDPEDGEL